MPSLTTIFCQIPDPGTGNAQRHGLLDILTIALVAPVCGAESCVDFVEFAEDRGPLPREFLSLENGLPSHDTFSRVFRLLDPEAFGQAFGAFVDDLGEDGAGVVALDGALVTGDAIHAQTETAQLVLERGGDYLFALKANRPAMHEAVAAFFAAPPEALDCHETTDADHGRVETRRHWLSHCVDWISGDRAEPGAPRMPGLATLACVETTRDDGPPCRRYYISSARLTPGRFARAVRAHRAIENSLHWMLDVTFDEDAARNRKDNGPENLAILRRLALNLLQTARSKLPISRKRKRAGWSDNFARPIIGQMQ